MVGLRTYSAVLGTPYPYYNLPPPHPYKLCRGGRLSPSRSNPAGAERNTWIRRYSPYSVLLYTESSVRPSAGRISVSGPRLLDCNNSVRGTELRAGGKICVQCAQLAGREMTTRTSSPAHCSPDVACPRDRALSLGALHPSRPMSHPDKAPSAVIMFGGKRPGGKRPGGKRPGGGGR